MHYFVVLLVPVTGNDEDIVVFTCTDIDAPQMAFEGLEWPRYIRSG